jgi:CspA family cold shock protein
LRPGDDVVLRFEPAQQDGFAFRAVKVWPAGRDEPPDEEPAENGPSAAYASRLTIRMDRDHRGDDVDDG